LSPGSVKKEQLRGQRREKEKKKERETKKEKPIAMAALLGYISAH